MDRIPHFFIVGAAKAGTSSLYEWLREASSIYMPSVKEPHFFSPSALRTPGIHTKVAGRDRYHRLFTSAAGGQIIGEASPSYLWDCESPRLIKAAAPRAKIIVLLRDPIERAYSHYLMDLRLGLQDMPFYKALLMDMADPRKEWGAAHLYVELGRYAEQLRRFFGFFEREQVKVLLFDDLISNPMGVMEQTLSFVGATECPDVPRTFEISNSAAVPRNRFAGLIVRHRLMGRVAKNMLPASLLGRLRDRLLLTREKPQMPRKARDFLATYYQPEMHELEKLLDIRLPWPWVKSKARWRQPRRALKVSA